MFNGDYILAPAARRENGIQILQNRVKTAGGGVLPGAWHEQYPAAGNVWNYPRRPKSDRRLMIYDRKLQGQ
jgi:hypothetical protein